MYRVGIVLFFSASLCFNLLWAEPVHNVTLCPAKCFCYLRTVNCSWVGRGMTEFPKLIPYSTEVLDLSFTGIPSVPFEPLSQLTNLTTLWLPYNNLADSQIDADAFSHLKRLSSVCLSSNYLTKVPRYLPPTVSTLIIDNTMISEVTIDDMEHFWSLTYLEMSDNPITSLGIDVFFYQQNLKTLRVSGLPLGFVSGEILINSLRMISFEMKKCQLKVLPPFRHPYLKTITLDLNEITVLEKRAFHLPSITSISLYGNEISEIEDGAFGGLENLQSLNLGGNKLVAITDSTFFGAPKLWSLELFSNVIERVEDDALSNLSELNNIGLSHNNLQSLDYQVFYTGNHSALKSFDISGNPWMCDCHLRWLRAIGDRQGSPIYFLDYITCAGPPFLAKLTWNLVFPEDFVCKNLTTTI